MAMGKYYTYNYCILEQNICCYIIILLFKHYVIKCLDQLFNAVACLIKYNILICCIILDYKKHFK